MRLRPILLILFVFGLLATQATAQEGGDGGIQLAREHFERGLDAFEKGDFEAAANEFRAAYAARPASAFIFNEAVSYERLDQRDRAAQLFKRYLEVSPGAKDRAAVEKRIARLGQGGTVTPQEEKSVRGVVIVETTPPGATIYLDSKSNEPLGKSPWNGSIVGKHTFIIVAPGYRDARQEVNVKPGTYSNLYIALSQDDYLGWLEVRSNVPSADVFIDDEEGGAVGRTPFMGNLVPGKHVVTVTRPGYTTDRKEIEITAGEAHRVDARIEPAAIGFVQVSGPDLDGATVTVDGKRVCTRVPCRFQTAAGPHRVSVSKKGRKTYSRSVPVERATESDLNVNLAPSRSRTGAILKLGVAAAFVGGGTFMTLRASSMQKDIDADPAATDEDKRNQKIFRYTGLGLFAAGGIAAVVAIVDLASDKGPKSRGTLESRDLGISITPDLGPGYRGVAAALRF
jgi:tetratricopeptide (TPR) repeat protein